MADRSPRLVTGSLTRRRWTRIRLLETSAWLWTAFTGLLAVSQVAGYTGFAVLYVLQALTPFTLAPSLPLALVASHTGRHRLAIANAAIAITLLWLAAPIVFHGNPPTMAIDAPRLTIRFANAYYGNQRTNAAAASLLASNADIIAIAEYPRRLEQALASRGALATYPYRLGRSSTDRGGIALLSRYPIVSGSFEHFGDQPGIEAVIAVHGTPVRVFVVHPVAATDLGSFETWQGDLRAIRERIDTPGPPTVVVGDFNASRWHPAFRELLDVSGYRDVHEWLGHGFSPSWPADALVPPFVRIDHALVRDGAVPLMIRDVGTPGSDHRGFLVTVALAA